MSETNTNQDSSAASDVRDASLKVDSSALEGDELDFAREMGFGDEPEPEPAPDPESPEEPVLADEDPAEAEVAEKVVEAEAEAEAADDPSEWEEIHPRPSAEGNQELLQTRAREVLAFAEQSASGGDVSQHASGAPAMGNNPHPSMSEVPAAPPAALPGVDRGEFDALEKERDALTEEYESLSTEHEFLLDQQATLNGQLTRSHEEIERLKTSLRAARTALTPLPEGERALRAEVLGLRDRLDVAHAENRRRVAESESAATELAIAQAHFEDRQHEVDVRRDEIADLERELAEANQVALAHTEKQRELLEISTRLQADNNELRSAQIALEETLEARNLEIRAREEHLIVTRDGLLARDRQILDLNALLESTRSELERAETELERRDLDAEQSQRALDRREERIASLSETLARIENVMGRRAEPLALRPNFDGGARGTAHGASGPLAASECDSPSAPKAEPRTLFSHWRNACLSEWMNTLEAETLSDYFAAHLAQAFDSEWPEHLFIRSLGGAGLDAEIALLEALRKRGASSILVEVSDPDAGRAELRAQRVEAAGYGEQIQVRVGSLSEAETSPPADAILLSDALFGLNDAAAQLESGGAGLSPKGRLFFVDQLRGGALTLSPDTLARIEEIWSVLPESLTTLPGLSEPPGLGETGGIEEADGPDLGTLFGDFQACAHLGFGHLADLVVGPARGASLLEEDAAAEHLLDSVMSLDESRSITEALPSRHGVGVFALGDVTPAPCGTLFSPEWSAADGD